MKGKLSPVFRDGVRELLPEELIITEKAVLGQVCAIWATNRQVLIDWINVRVDSGFFKGQKDAYYLYAALGGEQLGHPLYSLYCKTENDIPLHSVPCPCGNSNHWFIKYGE